MTKHQPKTIIDIDKWAQALTHQSDSYQQAEPYPHIVIDHFLENWAADQLLKAFPKVKDEGWIHYVHVNEKKHGLNKMELLPAFIQEVIKALNSDQFVQHLSKVTGIPNLLADESLEGGGLHQTKRDGFLNIHADFTVHPHKRLWRRRVNLLIYFNENWQEDYKGHLELWSKDMKECRQKISPIFNRCVIFNTDSDSYHGLPEPIKCPKNRTRKSLALYYFTEEKEAPKKRATNYRARPGDGFKAVFIYLDKKLISIYNVLKGWLGINDDFVSKVLHFFSSNKDKNN